MEKAFFLQAVNGWFVSVHVHACSLIENLLFNHIAYHMSIVVILMVSFFLKLAILKWRAERGRTATAINADIHEV